MQKNQQIKRLSWPQGSYSKIYLDNLFILFYLLFLDKHLTQNTLYFSVFLIHREW